MTLAEYLNDKRSEVVVQDTTWYGDFYFQPDNEFHKSFAKLVEVVETEPDLVVDITSLIDSHMERLDDAGLFAPCTYEDIMSTLPVVLAGYVSESWMSEFIACLSS